MTDDEFKRLLYKRLEEDKRNERVLTHRLYPQKEQKNKSVRNLKPKK